MSQRKDEPAFPVVSDEFGHLSGMTLRDYFAGQALTGMMAHPEHEWWIGNGLAVSAAYEVADAMIAERDR